MVEKTEERDASLLEKDLKKIISVLRKNFPTWSLANSSSYTFYDKNEKNASFGLEAGNFANEKIFEKAKLILHGEFPNLKYKKHMEYDIGNITIFTHDISGYEISLRKYPTQPELDKKISKVLTQAIPELGNSYFYDSHNHASKWRLNYTNPNNLDLHIS